jgi:hypothetical protein
MQVNKNQKKIFSIFDPSIRHEHREFYEEIVSELSVIIPVCTQGETLAISIGKNEAERMQIRELMKRVDHFSRQLLQITKKLFEQYYVAKSELNESILLTTAYNKINTLDRNLLERTCDVRWWALETAFSDCIQTYLHVQQNIDEIIRIINAIQERSLIPKDAEPDTIVQGAPQIQIIQTLSDFPKVLNQGVLETLITHFDILLQNNDFSPEDEEVLKEFLQQLLQLGQKIHHSCNRLEDINSSYTLYRDLVITDADGYIIATSNSERRNQVLGLNVSNEQWFIQAKATQNGTEYFAQDIRPSVVEEQLSLVYSTAVRENSDEHGNVIGVMGIFFDFQGEAGIILDEYMPLNAEGEIQDGCYSMFTSSMGKIIASTDECILEVGNYAHIPRRNRALADGDQVNTYMAFEGIDSGIFSSRTDGYLEYRGLGWSAHVILPKSHIYTTTAQPDEYNITAKELMKSRINPEINKQTYLKVQEDKMAMLLISLNGIVFASRLGKRGDELGPIFRQITNSSDFVTSKMEELLKEMVSGEFQLSLKTLENFAKQAIDLIDRNLFERSADIRWWSTDEYFWKALLNPSKENFVRAGARLKVINGSYTMYRNLVLSDANGEIVACSRTESLAEIAGINVSEQPWFEMGFQTLGSSEYAVQDVMESPLEKDKQRSLIYAGGVREDGARQGNAIGVLGILFDWDTEAKKILQTCLPKDREGKTISGSVAVYLNRKFEVIETTDDRGFPIGLSLPLPEQVAALDAGEMTSGLFEFQDQKYIYGACQTKGYREYKGLRWTACVLQPIF